MAALEQKDPLWPLDLLVNVLATLLAAFVVLLVATATFGSGYGMGIGGDSVCAAMAPGEGASWRMRDGDAVARDGYVRWGPLGLTDDAAFYETEIEICLKDPSVWQRIISGLSIWPEVLLFAGTLVLLRRIIVRARAYGLFSFQVARVVSLLGVVVLFGSLLVATIEAYARGLLVAQALVDPGWTLQMVSWHMSFSALIAGVGIICLGRVMARAVALQEDVDATV